MRIPHLLGRDAADHFCAVIDGLLTVECSLFSRESCGERREKNEYPKDLKDADSLRGARRNSSSSHTADVGALTIAAAGRSEFDIRGVGDTKIVTNGDKGGFKSGVFTLTLLLNGPQY